MKVMERGLGTEKKEGGIKAYKKPNEEIWKERKTKL